MTIGGLISNLFARSPIGPLEEHMRKVQSAVDTLVPFFEAVLHHQWLEAERYQHQIVDLEREADNIKKDLRIHLPQSLFLPVSRSDLLETLIAQDRIANKAKDIAGIVLGRKLNIPESIAPLYMPFLHRCIDASRQATQAINELDELLETGFRGREVTLVEQMILNLDTIENDTDDMQIVIRKQLFELERQLSPVDVIFLYKIIEWTGDLADRALTVGQQLQLLLAR